MRYYWYVYTVHIYSTYIHTHNVHTQMLLDGYVQPPLPSCTCSLRVHLGRKRGPIRGYEIGAKLGIFTTKPGAYLAVSGKLGLPQVTRLSIRSHDLMTWMIWGYPYDLENLHFSFHQTTAFGQSPSQQLGFDQKTSRKI